MAQNVMLFTNNFQKAQMEVSSLGGRVTHQLTDSVFIANLPSGVDVNEFTESQVEPPFSLDSTSQVMVNAWNAKQINRSLSIDQPEKPISWDTPGFQPPGKIPEPGSEEEDPSIQKKSLNLSPKSNGTPTSLFMQDSIAVGVVLVSGPTNNLIFSLAEKTKVIQEIIEGHTFLANLEPDANVSFTYDTHFLQINAKPNSNCDTFEGCESIWRDPALQLLGFQNGYNGCVEYVNSIRSAQMTRWAYVAFFTKYPQKHFAYAGGVRLCMQYANDGWGPDQINKVFAHETCHIFGAADEYGTCSCGNGGFLSIPNQNCVNCTTNQVDCVMNANSLEMCTWTKKQLGWAPYFLFLLHTATAITEADGANFTRWCVADLTGHSGTLFGIKTQFVGSGMVEVHALTAASSYQTFAIHAATAITQADGTNFSWCVADLNGQSGTLFGIKTQNVGSGMVEVHALTANDGYQTFAIHAATAITEADGANFASWCIGNLNGQSGTLFGIKTRNVESGMVEVHALSAASNYQTFLIQAVSQITEEDALNFDNWCIADFRTGSNGADLFSIKIRNVESGMVEAHVLKGNESATTGLQ